MLRLDNPDLRDLIQAGKFAELKAELLGRGQAESIGEALFAVALLVESGMTGQQVRDLANNFFS